LLHSKRGNGLPVTVEDEDDTIGQYGIGFHDETG
jgi:hypothetical protein